MIDVRVQAEDFDGGAELAALEGLGGGGVASFTGIVRGGGGLSALVLEHYPAMTQLQLERIADEAARRWSLLGIRIIHRVGALAPGARIVFVGTASPHRTAALESCAFLIDWLKTDAPFWKKEILEDGAERWVEARQEDVAKAAGWNNEG
ncbi:molybdenum cofactor biosynthesis protein MoaE [Sphingobium sp. H39-3-25]|uniref:molybdenum cofactor biosynthesis protein MoaE n=1 Tax=Sphingobium arseniciresistens TaxID=3030834 RepID=UPI0023B8AC3A|nr:molybdenum cofactor biosynthesis protein MoaE [Sphingobium arseniciresistens]